MPEIGQTVTHFKIIETSAVVYKAIDLNFPSSRIEANPELRALVADPRFARTVQVQSKQR